MLVTGYQSPFDNQKNKQGKYNSNYNNPVVLKYLCSMRLDMKDGSNYTKNEDYMKTIPTYFTALTI